MKTTTDFIFPDAFKTEAEEYISYKRSLGFSFSIDDQRKLSYMLNYIYIHNHNDVTHLTKEVVDSFLSQSNGSKPCTLHANQSFIRKYGLYLQLNGYDSYVYPDRLIQCPKDFIPYILQRRNPLYFYVFGSDSAALEELDSMKAVAVTEEIPDEKLKELSILKSFDKDRLKVLIDKVIVYGEDAIEIIWKVGNPFETEITV